MSNWACNHAPSIHIPTAFGLNGFAFTILPDPHTQFGKSNDGIHIEHYRRASRSYSGPQRKGVGEPPPNASSYEGNIRAALQAPFPLSEELPLHADLKIALDFNCNESREAIAEFRSSQLKSIRIISDELQHETVRRYRFSPE